jgi:2-polyprenyl-3-methyl-5-hydroxy-6-metoxy-1,4-benzoquinol methylase
MSDPLGAALMDYLTIGQAVISVEREDGRISREDIALHFRDYRQWPQAEKSALAFAAGRVLDIGCGAGRHALYLSTQGSSVVAVDKSPGAIVVCQRRGVEHAYRVAGLEDAIRTAPGQFDTILMLWGNFGLFGNLNRADRLLRRIRKVCAPGARILAASADPNNLTKSEDASYRRFNVQRGRAPG